MASRPRCGTGCPTSSTPAAASRSLWLGVATGTVVVVIFRVVVVVIEVISVAAASEVSVSAVVVVIVYNEKKFNFQLQNQFHGTEAAEEVARFQRLSPNPSWLVRKVIRTPKTHSNIPTGNCWLDEIISNMEVSGCLPLLLLVSSRLTSVCTDV